MPFVVPFATKTIPFSEIENLNVEILICRIGLPTHINYTQWKPTGLQYG